MNFLIHTRLNKTYERMTTIPKNLIIFEFINLFLLLDLINLFFISNCISNFN